MTQLITISQPVILDWKESGTLIQENFKLKYSNEIHVGTYSLPAEEATKNTVAIFRIRKKSQSKN